MYVKFHSKEVAFCYINHYLGRYSSCFYPHSQAALRIFLLKIQIFTWFTSQPGVWLQCYEKKQMHTAVKEPHRIPSSLQRRVYTHRWNLYVLLLTMQKNLHFFPQSRSTSIAKDIVHTKPLSVWIYKHNVTIRKYFPLLCKHHKFWIFKDCTCLLPIPFHLFPKVHSFSNVDL